MKAWKRSINGTIGTAFAIGFCLIGTGCLESVKVEWEASGRLDYHKSIVDIPSKYDLDVEHTAVEFDGKKYNYYASQQCLHNQLTSELFRKDDPSIKHLFESLPKLTCVETVDVEDMNNSSAVNVCGSVSRIISSEQDSLSSQIEAAIYLDSKYPIPVWDVDRWPSLDRQIYVFPDGIVGNSDSLNLILTGELCDVFGYMAELGVTQGTAMIDDDVCSLFIDDEGLWADVFVNDVLFGSIWLN
ncbi:MAG: hypothetical protein QF718_05500 [Phycisphaerales bacterium]|jgi:hypothetical protein|nr:hypothetical protein [Phycisphaerales bacterium]